MEKEQALKILNALANGVHPATGEVFAADSAYQHPDTVRALFEGIRALEGSRPGAASSERRTGGMGMTRQASRSPRAYARERRTDTLECRGSPSAGSRETSTIGKRAGSTPTGKLTRARPRSSTRNVPTLTSSVGDLSSQTS